MFKPSQSTGLGDTRYLSPPKARVWGPTHTARPRGLTLIATDFAKTSGQNVPGTASNYKGGPQQLQGSWRAVSRVGWLKDIGDEARSATSTDS